MKPEQWGIEPGFWDAGGSWRASPASTVRRVLEAMGADRAGPGSAVGPVVTVRLDGQVPGQLAEGVPSLPPGRLVLEDGSELDMPGGRRLPAGVPAGYHRLETAKGDVSVVVSPGRCPLPGTSGWGFAVQLYATRSERSWGIGDFADLRRICRWSSSLDASMVLVSPLHAGRPGFPQTDSPYFPGSRCFLNPLYLAVEEVPGARGLPEVDMAADAGRRLNRDRLIDRDRVWRIKSWALEAVFGRWWERGFPEEFSRYRVQRGEVLEGFALYCAIAERHGPRWRAWPSSLGHPGSPEVRKLADEPALARRITYHAWLQWLLDDQLARVTEGPRGPGGPGDFSSRALGAGDSCRGRFARIADLAVGVDRDGPDGWLFQDCFAPEMDIGAPPDRFNALGQNWGLPPFDPWRLRAAGYRPWIESLRGTLRHSGGIRVDHVMGLFRLFWIPSGCSPAEGVYVRYPQDELLDILTLEAHRAGAFVVGEDLGTVEDEVRAELSRRDVLSYRLWWFESQRPASWPARALGAVGTHDLPTIAGVLDGSDLNVQRQLGLQPDEEAAGELRRRLMQWSGSEEGTEPALVVERVYADLATAPCLLLSASLEDMALVSERPNMPGTTTEWPNWRIALPIGLEALEAKDLPAAVAGHLARRSGSAVGENALCCVVPDPSRGPGDTDGEAAGNRNPGRGPGDTAKGQDTSAQDGP